MAKKKGSAGIGNIPVRMDSASVEAQTVERVDRTLENLKGFLSRWDASGKKPAGQFPQIVKIRRFYDALSTWRTESIRAGKTDDDDARMRRLRYFVAICRLYS